MMANHLIDFKGTTQNFNDGFQWWEVARWNNRLLNKVILLFRFMVMNIEECMKMKCNCHDEISLTHILFRCEEVRREREVEWQNLGKVVPRILFTEMEDMNSDDRANFILSCFNSKPIKEWIGVYESILIFTNVVITSWSVKCKM